MLFIVILDERENGIPKSNYQLSLEVTKNVPENGMELPCSHVDIRGVKDFPIFRIGLKFHPKNILIQYMPEKRAMVARSLP